MPGEKAKAVTVEAHLTGLNPGSHYHALLVATNAGGESKGVDQEFVPTLDPPQNCPNEQLRKENSSVALPECRAYEQVTPPDKGGLGASLNRFSDDGDAVVFVSDASNIANSGKGTYYKNSYVTVRSDIGWKTLADLNGPSGSINAEPDGFISPPENLGYSSDLRTSLWSGNKGSDPTTYGASLGSVEDIYLRNPDGTFTQIGKHGNSDGAGGEDGRTAGMAVVGASDDLSHVFVNGAYASANVQAWGPGVYEFVGTGNDQPRRVDVDNTGSPISTCDLSASSSLAYSAQGSMISADGRTLVFTVGGGCGAPNPPAKAIWARVGGTTSFDVSASRCTRPDCNAPADATFVGAAKDGSRVFFTTTQQLVNGDTDLTNDLYACDIPSGTPAPAGEANPCSALRQVSAGDPSGAAVESVGTVSNNGSTVLFTAKGVLADNEDAFGEEAVAGDHNLYPWRTDAAHPDGQTTFVARLDSNDLSETGDKPQTTPEGRYLVFTTANQLVPTDTDTARDVYRYDADAGELTRVSVGTSGASGNADAFNVSIRAPAASNDGESIVFTTAEPLSPLDGNGEVDTYLWRAGHVFLISTGSVGGGSGAAAISASGRDIYFGTSQQLVPSDRDYSEDVYDARIEGGFSFVPEPVCTGEACQPPRSGPPASPAPETAKPGGEGNVKPPKPCPKGKVRNKKGKCVPKHKKHQKKSHKKAGHNRGGSK